jgi:hypothetical protein
VPSLLRTGPQAQSRRISKLGPNNLALGLKARWACRAGQPNALDFGRAEAMKSRARRSRRVQDAIRNPVTHGVFVHTKAARCFADRQEFGLSRCFKLIYIHVLSVP